jgi:2-polyprenyl-3-methyl-5-hydroxy-6-metoxy-1,4-benzoquinol methylase
MKLSKLKELAAMLDHSAKGNPTAEFQCTSDAIDADAMPFENRAETFTRAPWVNDKDLVLAAVRDLTFGRCAGHVLDIGGGTGALAQALSHEAGTISVTVVDPSQSMLRLVQPPVITACTFFENFIGRPVYDTIVLRQVMQYVFDPVATLMHAAELMSTEAYLYIGQIVAPTESAAKWLLDVGGVVSPGRNRVFTETQLLKLVDSIGLKVLFWKTFPYTESVKDWAVRASLRDSDEVVTQAQMLMTPEVASDLDAFGDSITVHLTWAHIILIRPVDAK